MKLGDLFRATLHAATASGQDRRANLSHGARMTVRRVNQDYVMLTIARRGAPVGEREEITFRTHCGVPASAQRYPKSGQWQRAEGDVVWHIVGYQWREGRPAEVNGQAAAGTTAIGEQQ